MGTESIPNLAPECLSLLEKFVSQMDVVSTRILKEYTGPVSQILKQWKQEEKSSSSDSDSDSDEEEKNNDFHVDKDRIRAAHFYEKTNERLTFDPDMDGFNFGYEKALTFKVRVNMLKIIRKEILSNKERFWEHSQEALKQICSPEVREKYKLPDNWRQEVHDRNLLKAVGEHGLNILSKLKDNPEFGFSDIRLSRKRFLRRVE